MEELLKYVEEDGKIDQDLVDEFKKKFEKAREVRKKFNSEIEDARPRAGEAA